MLPHVLTKYLTVYNCCQVPALQPYYSSLGIPTVHHLVLGDESLSKPDKVMRKKKMGEVLEQTFPTAKDKVKQ